MMLRLTQFGLSILIVLSAARVVSADQVSAATQPASDDARNIHIYLVTFGPGDDAWEKFGHNAVRVVLQNLSDEAIVNLFPMLSDKAIGRLQLNHDLLYHWGGFQFGPGFLGQFVQGKLMYSMMITQGEPSIALYANGYDGYPGEHRDVRQQELNLTSEQKVEFIRRLCVNFDDLSQRKYRYDYYTDNCSTRTRDAIDNLIDHRLKSATRGKLTATSYRFHTDRLAADTPWLYLALDGVLAQPVDRPIDEWQEMFLPEKVHDRVKELRIVRDGQEVPLALSDDWLNQSTRPAEPPYPPLMAPWFFAAGLLLGSLFVFLGRFSRQSWSARGAFVLATTPWLLLMTVGGGLIAWAWVGTDHAVCRYNENVLQVSVLALPLLILLPMLVCGLSFAREFTQWLLYTIAGLGVLGLLLKVLPGFTQLNWSIIALCLPTNLGLAYAANGLRKHFQALAFVAPPQAGVTQE